MYQLGKEYFQLLKSSDQSLQAIMENILQKELKVQATHLRGVPRNFAKEQEDQEDEKDRKQMQEQRYRRKL